MGYRFSGGLAGVALLAIACSGHDILLSTGNAGAASGGAKGTPDSGLSGTAGGGGDSEGGSFSGGGGAAGGEHRRDPGSGGGAGERALGGSGGDDVIHNEAGAGGTQDGPVEPEHGGWLAYDLDLATAFGTRQIQILRADGSCERNFVWPTDGGKTVKQPAFSADGKQIAFASDSTGVFQIYVMDLVSRERRQITSEPEGATYPSWSPTGTSIAYVMGDPEDQFDRTHPLDSTSTVKLIDTTTLETTALTDAGHPAYTASAFAGDHLLLVGNSISVVGIHTDSLTRYDAAPPTAFSPTLTSPTISPDRSRFVLSAACGTQSQLYVARSDGTTGAICDHATPLAANSDGLITASWGLAGYIAAETSHHDLVLVPSDGSLGIKVLVNTTQPERNPAFAPASVALDCTP